MLLVCSYFLVIYLIATVAQIYTPNRHLRQTLLAAACSAWLLILFLYGSHLLAWQRLLIGCVGSLWLIKVVARQTPAANPRPYLPLVRELLYRFVWPGMSDAPFAHRKDATKSDANLFVRGHIAALSGIALMLTLALVSRQIGDRTLGLIGILPFFLLIHFGYADMLTSTLRLARHPVGVLFDQPWRSTSLRDFWSNRWNRPFVEMNRALFFRGAASKFGRTAGLLIAFLVSGFLHELGISYPAGGGWGLPTMYFMIQGVLLVLEEKRLVPTSRLWVWLTVLLPIPLLFHEPFQNALVVPLYRQLGVILLSYSPEEYLGWLIPIAGSAHAIVLIAGTQVPAKLGWKTDLAKLTPFNRKIVWNYGAFIFLLILAFGLETLIFHEEMVRGEPAAIGMASLICAFWLLRLLVDCFYFSHSDWPEGAEFIVGHTLLNSLFLFLVLSYGTLLAWHCWRPVPL